jgi:hypothetical protein
VDGSGCAHDAAAERSSHWAEHDERGVLSPRRQAERPDMGHAQCPVPSLVLGIETRASCGG